MAISAKTYLIKNFITKKVLSKLVWQDITTLFYLIKLSLRMQK